MDIGHYTYNMLVFNLGLASDLTLITLGRVGAYVPLRTFQLVCQGFREHTQLVFIALQAMY